MNLHHHVRSPSHQHRMNNAPPFFLSLWLSLVAIRAAANNARRCGLFAGLCEVNLGKRRGLATGAKYIHRDDDDDIGCEYGA